MASQHALGVCYAFGQGIPQDDTLSLLWFEKAAKQGDADSQYQVARSYLLGRGVAKNQKLAFEWFVKSAQQGDVNAEFSLGKCYFYGMGVPQDYHLSIKWLKKAYNKEHISAKILLMVAYEKVEKTEEAQLILNTMTQHEYDNMDPDIFIEYGKFVLRNTEEAKDGK